MSKKVNFFLHFIHLNLYNFWSEFLNVTLVCN